MKTGSFIVQSVKMHCETSSPCEGLLATMSPCVELVWPLGSFSSACGGVPLVNGDGERSPRVTGSP